MDRAEQIAASMRGEGETGDGPQVVQMPGGVPVATVAVGNARNAGLLAVRILATSDEKLRAAMEHYQADLAQQVHDKDAAVQERYSPNR